MLTRQPIADLVLEFPQLAGSAAWTTPMDDDAQWSELVRLLRGLYLQRDFSRLQAAFDHLERFLDDDDAQVQIWVAGFLQTLQEALSWNSEDEAFLRFMGNRSRHIWAALNTIRFDLANCSTLEAEILMWRMVHPRLHIQPHHHDAYRHC